MVCRKFEVYKEFTLVIPDASPGEELIDCYYVLAKKLYHFPIGKDYTSTSIRENDDVYVTIKKGELLISTGEISWVALAELCNLRRMEWLNDDE